MPREEVDVILNTLASQPKKEGDLRNDRAVWGEPVIVVRRSPYCTRSLCRLLDLQAQFRPLREELLAAIARVCDSQRFVVGPEVDALEQELAKYLDVAEAVAVSSGTDALLASMMALGIGPGDEVITSTYSFFATAGCVTRLGATPRLVDIDPVTYNVDPAAIRRALTPRTKAILPVHLYGLLRRSLDPILSMAAEAGIPVIEDACQAIGGRPAKDARPARSAMSAAFRSSPARTSARSAMPGS